MTLRNIYGGAGMSRYQLTDPGVIFVPGNWDPTAMRRNDMREVSSILTDSSDDAAVRNILTNVRGRTGWMCKTTSVYDGISPINTGNWPKTRAQFDAETDIMVMVSLHIWGIAANAFYGRNLSINQAGNPITPSQREIGRYVANPLLYLEDIDWLEAVAGDQLPGWTAGGGIPANGHIYNQMFRAGATLGGWTQRERRSMRIQPLMHELTWNYHHAGRVHDDNTAATRALYNPRLIAGQPAAYRSCVRALRAGASSVVAGAGNDLKFVWSLGGFANVADEPLYPGDAWVDVISVNDYSNHHHNNEWPPADSRADTNRLFSWARPFCRLHNKPLGMNELGVSSKWQTRNNYDHQAKRFYANIAPLIRGICNDLTGPGISHITHFEREKGKPIPPIIGNAGTGENIAARLGFQTLSMWLWNFAPANYPPTNVAPFAGEPAYPARNDGGHAQYTRPAVGATPAVVFNEFESNYPYAALECVRQFDTL